MRTYSDNNLCGGITAAHMVDWTLDWLRFLPSSALGLWFWATVELVLQNVFVLTACTTVGLVAIWAALGRRHWFVRVVVLGIILSPTLAIPAYELLLVFITQSVVVIVPIGLARRFWAYAKRATRDASGECSAGRRCICQFTLADLLLLTVVAAAIFSIASMTPAGVLNNWVELVSVGVCAGICTLVGAWAGLGRRRFRLRLCSLILFSPAVLVAGWLALARASGCFAHKSTLTASHGTQTREGGTRRLWPVRLARIGVAILSLLLLIPPTAVYYTLIRRAPFPTQAETPDPNGYDDLLRAGRRVERHVQWIDPETASESVLREFVTDYDGVLKTVRIALDQECRVPALGSQMVERTPDFSAIPGLGVALIADGKLAEMEGRTADAMRSYLDTVRLGVAMTRGGVFEDVLIGWSVRDLGVKELRGLRSRLTPQQCNALIRVLQDVSANQESLATISARDRAWMDHTQSWQERLTYRLQMITGCRRKIEKAGKRYQTRMDLLICELALQLYHGQCGVYPAELVDLVPKYLPTLPEDPFTGKPFVYRRQGTGYLLRSEFDP